MRFCERRPWKERKQQQQQRNKYRNNYLPRLAATGKDLRKVGNRTIAHRKRKFSQSFDSRLFVVECLQAEKYYNKENKVEFHSWINFHVSLTFFKQIGQ